MQETILLTPGLNGTELLRSLALYGVNTLGWRVMNAAELAKTALMKSGKILEGEFLPRRDEAAVFASFLQSINYFHSASYADSENLASTLYDIRMLVTEEDEEKALLKKLSEGAFKEKNNAILEAYRKYRYFLEASNQYDTVSLIRSALVNARPFPARFLILEEFPLSPLEKKLIDHLSSSSIEERNLISVFGKNPCQTSICSFSSGYGSINEAEDVLKSISSESLDRSTVVLADNSYLQLFYDLSLQYEIPMTFGSGIPIANTNPAKLLKRLLFWNTHGNHGVDSLKAILVDDAFDSKKLAARLGLETLSLKDTEDIAKMAGNLRLSFSSEENRKKLNRYKPVLEKELSSAKKTNIFKEIKMAERKLLVFSWIESLAECLEAGYCGILEEFAFIRFFGKDKRNADEAALETIRSAISSFEIAAKGHDVTEIIPELLQKTVCSESYKEGFLHVTSLAGGFSAIRPKLFVCGLNSSFPGSPEENYLMLDDDLMSFGKEEILPTSANRITRKKDSLEAFLSFASALGSEIHLSYSRFDLAEIKEQNPSSTFLDFLEMADKDIIKVGYFQSGLSSSSFVGKAYLEGSVAIGKELLQRIDSGLLEEAKKHYWSPSELEVFFQCPRRFYLTRVCHLPEKEEDNPSEIINASDTGTLAHSLMEEIITHKEMDKDSFLILADKAFEDFLLSRPPLHPSSVKEKKKDFLRMMADAYMMDPHNEVVAAEEDYRATHSEGILIHGYPDRVEKTKDGRYIIADFKTKRHLDHKENDIETCLQVVIYAWLLREHGIPIMDCEYRYMRLKETVHCSYDAKREAELAEKLKTFRDALENGTFGKTTDSSNCRYCTMKDICSREGEAEEMGVEEDV